jgi:hypothetical protein
MNLAYCTITRAGAAPPVCGTAGLAEEGVVLVAMAFAVRIDQLSRAVMPIALRSGSPAIVADRT